MAKGQKTTAGSSSSPPKQATTGTASSSTAPAASSSQVPATAKSRKAKGRKDDSERVEDLTPERKPYTPAQLSKMIPSAVRLRQKNHDNGFAFVTAVEDPNSDQQLVAGYLNFHSVTEMLEWWKKPGKGYPIRPLLNAFRGVRFLNAFNKGPVSYVHTPTNMSFRSSENLNGIYGSQKTVLWYPGSYYHRIQIRAFLQDACRCGYGSHLKRIY